MYRLRSEKVPQKSILLTNTNEINVDAGWICCCGIFGVIEGHLGFMRGVGCITHHQKGLGILYKTGQESDLICNPVTSKKQQCTFASEKS